jgi:hypothetical protein
MTKSGHMTIKGPVDAQRFLMIFDRIEKPFSLSWVSGEKRTSAQNRTIHKWYKEVADAAPDQTFYHVKAQCNMKFGVPILRRDDAEWCETFDDILRPLGYAKALEAIERLDIPFTRRMTVSQLSEYMDAMQEHFAHLGVRLTDPEALKYEEEMR